MDEGIRYRGRVFTGWEIEEIRELIFRYPDKSRFLLSKELCRLWNWTQANGTSRDMLCRGLLLKLHAEGRIVLPPQKRVPTWLKRRERKPVKIEVDESPCEVPLDGLRPLIILMVRRTPIERLLFRSITTSAAPSPSGSICAS